MTSRQRAVWVALPVCLMGAVLTAQVAFGARPPKAPPVAYNDRSLLVEKDNQRPWEAYAPPVERADDSYRVPSPPGVEVEKCMRWLRKFVTPAFLPADLSGHLMAMRKWPKSRGEDVFVVWYVAHSRLVHIVEENGKVVVFTVPVGQRQAPAAPEQRMALAVRVAKTVLTKEMLPHPLGPPLRNASQVPGMSSGVWLPVDLQVKKEPGSEARFPGWGLLSVQTPASGTAHSVRFLTDGRFVQFTLTKFYPGPSGPPPFTPRFEGTSTGARPSPRHESQ